MAKGINVINKETINSYQEVINAINEEIKKGTTEITIDIIFEAGLKKIIRMDDKTIVDKWNELKNNVTGKPINNKEDIFVRKHGQNGKTDDKLTPLLINVFGKRNFNIDPSNNSQPKDMLEKAFEKVEYEDYQISHLFEERTNNPLLFTAPWMICYTPKIIDPFTGHETKGYSDLRKKFISWAYKKNKTYIEEYNIIIMRYWNELKEVLNKGNGSDTSSKFKKHMIVALAPIIIEAEMEETKAGRTRLYLEQFNELDKKNETALKVFAEKINDNNSKYINQKCGLKI